MCILNLYIRTFKDKQGAFPYFIVNQSHEKTKTRNMLICFLALFIALLSLV